jgi:NADH-quinone oxidoreductase subunit H
MVSYEVAIGLILLSTLACVGSLNLLDLVTFQYNVLFAIPMFPVFIMFLVSILAETNRAPFDLPEAESELVSGYNVEYSSMGFALFFLGEYSSMILMSALTTIAFLGG